MFFFFFFKQKTAYEMRISDWSSDVCSSDLTAFNVDLFGPQVLITLIEGHVQVLEATSSRAAPKAEPVALRRGQGQVAAPQEPVELRRGQRLVAAPQRPVLVQQVDVDRIPAWQQGQLVFDNEPPAVVAARGVRSPAEPDTVADASLQPPRPAAGA